MKNSIILAVGLCLALGACTSKDYQNPSTTTPDRAVADADGLIALCNGLQVRYSTGGAASVPYNAAALGGLSTRELVILNQGNTEENNIAQGGANVVNNNGVVRNVWTQCLLVRSNADLILANAGNAVNPGSRSGIIAYASIFRALALGTLAQYFEQAPLITAQNAPFVPRAQLLAEAISTLETAATTLAATSVSADFTAKIAPGINLTNTIQALIARYSLEAGGTANFDKAIAAAGRVNLALPSVFNFDDIAQNPIFVAAFGNRNVFEPTDVNLGLTGILAPDPADRRIPFLVRLTPTATQNRGTAFYTANSAPIPVYVPGEILLIRAEAFARKTTPDLANAVIELNRVRTKTPTQDAFGLGAGLPAYSGPLTQDAILLDVLENRFIELAFQGFRLGDSRRFGRPGPGAVGPERNRNFYPYPRTERENNNQTPADPVN